MISLDGSTCQTMVIGQVQQNNSTGKQKNSTGLNMS